MQRPTQQYTPELLLIGAGLALRLAFALLPIEWLFMLLEDDAWMVTAIARNWAHGLGITADGLHPTNGFHPLYPLTLGALPYLFDLEGLHTGFRINLLICALLNTLALLPFYGLARAVASRPVALAGLAIVALNPFLVRVSVNAMETSLALLLLLTLWWAALVHPPQRLGGAALLGVLAGLAILARLDNALAAGFVGLALLWHELHERRWPGRSLAYGAAAAVVLLPYVARNLFVFGALTPSSGRALSYMHSFRESFAFTSGLQLVAYQPAFNLTWAPAWLLAAGVLLLAWLFWTLPRPQRTLLTPLVLYALVLTFYYSYLQMQGRPRYYVAVGIVIVLLLCARLMGRNERRITDNRGWELGLGRLALVLLAVGLNSTMTARYALEVAQAPYQAQPAMYAAARWIAHNLPPDARVAAQNSGIFQYYSERVVLNFDGKLNHEIIPVLEQRELDTYLRERGISYIVDLPGVADYIEFYSSTMSEAPRHEEMSALDKLATYGRLIAARVGLGPPVQLDEREPERVVQPFENFATVIERFPLPNNPDSAVLIYRLHDEFGSQP
jgi:hypothetical protein